MSKHKRKTILITGAGSGIGKETALRLAKRGHHVLATTHTTADAKMMNRLAKERKLSLKSFVLDVTNPKDRAKVAKYGIHVLINNAGIGETGSLAEIDVAKVRNNFEVNLFGPLELTQIVLKNMIKNDHGTVIFISSLLGRITSSFFGSYSMTKFAITSGSEALRQELAQISKHIHVSVVEPGSYHTGFNQEMMATKYEWMDKKSYFHAIIDKIKKREKKQFDFSESRDITSIVNKIIAATEAVKPKLRYSAPGWQVFFVQLWRMFGK